MPKKKKPAAELLDKMLGGEAVTINSDKTYDRDATISDLRTILGQARSLLSTVVSAGTMIATPEATKSGKVEELKKLASTLTRDCRSFSDEIFRLEGSVNSLKEVDSDDEFIGRSFELASSIAEAVERFQSTAPQLADEIIKIVTNKEGA